MQFNQNINKHLKELQKTLSQSKSLVDGVVKQLPASEREVLAPLQGEMSEVLRAMKAGNTSKLQAIVNNPEKLMRDAGLGK